MDKTNFEAPRIQLPPSDFLQQRSIQSTLLHLKPWQAYGRHVRAGHPKLSEDIAWIGGKDPSG